MGMSARYVPMFTFVLAACGVSDPDATGRPRSDDTVNATPNDPAPTQDVGGMERNPEASSTSNEDVLPPDIPITGGLALAPNQWTNVTPTYEGAPNGGFIAPFSFNHMGVYDPYSKRTISFERWYDDVRGMSIYANALVAYDPGKNVATVLKVSNWSGGNQPLPENETDPTPIDRHPCGGLGLVPSTGAVYLVNGANQSGRAYYPDHPNDTWKFSLAKGSWSLIADAKTDIHPPTDVTWYSGMVHDPKTGKLVYFVLTPSSGTQSWLLDPTSNQWSMAPPDPSATDVYISIAGLAYDTKRERILAYGGGYNSASPPSPKLWAYSASANKWTRLADAPIGGEASEFAYDSTHDVFLAIVGQATLIYDAQADSWTQLPATLERGRIANRQNVTYDPAYDVFVFQGGAWDAPVWSLFRYAK
jgi:hypothetical protein